MNDEFDYNEERDDLPRKTLIWIIVIAAGLALYLSQILV